MDKLKDNFFLGLLLGVLVPMVSYALIMSLLELVLAFWYIIHHNMIEF